MNKVVKIFFCGLLFSLSCVKSCDPTTFMATLAAVFSGVNVFFWGKMVYDVHMTRRQLNDLNRSVWVLQHSLPRQDNEFIPNHIERESVLESRRIEQRPETPPPTYRSSFTNIPNQIFSPVLPGQIVEEEPGGTSFSTVFENPLFDPNAQDELQRQESEEDLFSQVSSSENSSIIVPHPRTISR